MSSRFYPKLKDVDEVLGGPAAWENAQVTEGEILNCLSQIEFQRRARNVRIIVHISCNCRLEVRTNRRLSFIDAPILIALIAGKINLIVINKVLPD